jgi:hypothetical protein
VVNSFPSILYRSLAQAFYELRKALGLHSAAYFNISPTLIQYRKDHFIIGIDCEKILDASFTGLDAKAGQLLTINISGANGNIPLNICLINYMLHFNMILYWKLSDSGAVVFD